MRKNNLAGQWAPTEYQKEKSKAFFFSNSFLKAKRHFRRCQSKKKKTFTFQSNNTSNNFKEKLPFVYWKLAKRKQKKGVKKHRIPSKFFGLPWDFFVGTWKKLEKKGINWEKRFSPLHKKFVFRSGQKTTATKLWIFFVWMNLVFRIEVFF